MIIADGLNWVIILLILVLAAIAVVHALLYKYDPRAAFGWIGLCLVFPVGGPILYFLFGINRVQTRAKRLKSELPSHDHELPDGADEAVSPTASPPTGCDYLARISE